MKKLNWIGLYFAIFFAFSAQAQRKSFTEITGGSLAEKQVQWIWKHRMLMLKSCQFDIQDCSRDPIVAGVLEKLIPVMIETAEDKVQFVSEKENPHFFVSEQGEAHRIAITSSNPRDPIYFNSDLIPELNLYQLTGIVFHELSHKAGILDDSQRIPDIVGAALNSHLKKTLALTAYPFRNGRQIQMATFRSVFPEIIGDPKQFDLGPLTGFAFLTDGDLFVDIDTSQFEIEPGCDDPKQMVLTQVVDVPVWVPSKDKANALKGIVLMNNFCVNMKTGANGISHRNLLVELEFSDVGKLLRDSLVIGLSDNMNNYIEYLSTIEVLSSQTSPEPVKAGQELVLQMKIRNKGALKAQKCDVAFSPVSDRAPSDNNGTWLIFDSCELQAHGDSDYLLIAKTQLPPGLKTADYRISRMRISGTGGYGAAFLHPASEVRWKIEGTHSSEDLLMKGPGFSGLEPIVKKMADYPVEDSFMYSLGQRFQIEFEVNTLDPLKLVSLDMILLLRMGDEIESNHAYGEPEDLKMILRAHRFIKVGSKQILQMDFELPKYFLDTNLVYGMRLDGIVVQNIKTAEVANFRNDKPYRFLVMIDELVKLNQE